MISGRYVRRWSRFGLFSALVAAAGCAADRDIEQPAPLFGAVPIEFPLDLWDAGVEGETLLKVGVNELGHVDSAVVVRSSGYPAFDSAAVRGAMQLQFRPAKKKGKRIEVWANVPVRFSKNRGR